MQVLWVQMQVLWLGVPVSSRLCEVSLLHRTSYPFAMLLSQLMLILPVWRRLPTSAYRLALAVALLVCTRAACSGPMTSRASPKRSAMTVDSVDVPTPMPTHPATLVGHARAPRRRSGTRRVLRNVGFLLVHTRR